MELIITTDLLQQAQAVFNTLDISEGTREDYKKSVREFVRFIAGKNFTHNSFLEFKQFLKTKNNIGVSTKNGYMTSARILLKEMNRTGLLPADITQNVHNFKQEKKHKKDGLNQAEIDMVCERISKLPRDIESMRLKAIFSLLIFQGLRQEEVTEIDVTHLDLERSSALITGKGRDDQERINLHPEAVRMLSDYIQEHRIADGPLFFSLSNNARGQRLTTKSLRRLIKAEFKDLNILRSTHGFRHYFVTTLIKKLGGDLVRVAQLTRHKSFDMLQVYNDGLLTKEGLPDYYAAFEGVRLV